ncbi:unnamed protein product [Oncorhynchus mykiss]|uniref:LIM zinc-binding domain-containing protein n=1 Tax=Oncorhynchus mykiss TaxID=8022 RepID=A0A060XCQ9_ONCMY|nr:unnamed protein product [Oncorhynchus mykiss]
MKMSVCYWISSIGSRLNSLASLDQDVFEDSAPVLRTLPPRSYTFDNPYTPLDRLRPTRSSVLPPREEACAATTATNKAVPPSRGNMSDSIDSPFGSGSDITTTVGRTPNVPAPNPSERAPSLASRYTSAAKTEETFSTTTTPSLLPKAHEPSRPWVGKVSEEVTPSTGGGSLYIQQPQYNSVVMDPQPVPPGVSRVSASLPRSYMRSDSARLNSVFMPRPFGSQSTSVASLPPAYTAPLMADSQKSVNGETDFTKKLSAPSRYIQVMTSEDKAHSLSSSAHSSGEEEEEEEKRGVTPTLATTLVPTLAPSPVPSQARSPSPALQTPKVAYTAPVSPLPTKDQESYADMRISLNQKSNSSRDFGFQTEWDSTGAHVTSIQPGSPAELCQLQVGDEVMSVSGQRVAEMSYGKWKSSTEQALQQGSLTMDIRRHGRNNWDRDLPSLPFKSHKTINLTSMDHHPTVIGFPDTTTVNATTSLDFTSRGSMETTKKVTTQPIIDVASNGVNGGFRDETVTVRNKGGSESAKSDMPVASIAPSSNRLSCDPEEERRRQEKWQKEQERLLQEKYRRDQEKLEEEWRRAQQEAMTEGGRHHQEQPRGLETDSRSISPLSPLRQPTMPWEDERGRRVEEEAQRRQEEEERRRVEEERQKWEEGRRKEEKEQELLRLQEERKRREKQEDEERRQREKEELRWQREKGRQEAAEQQHKEKEKMQEQQQQWAKSKSTPELDNVEKTKVSVCPGWYGSSGGMAQRLLEEELRRKTDKKAQSLRAASELELERRNILNAMRYREPERVTSSCGMGEELGRKGQQSVPQAELERQQILQEMKKKTNLATDNSWIRQRSTSTTNSKDPTASPIRRGESLDNLDTAPRSSWRSSWTPGSTSSIPNYSRPHLALSGLKTTSSYSGVAYGGGGYGSGVGSRPGLATLPSSLSMSSLREARGSVSGKKICTFCDTVLGKGAAMIIESLGLCYHLTCFKCIDCKSDLGGSEAGAEVRIRNRQLYCNSCYMRFKTGQPTSM